jgi:Peptidase family M23
MRVPFEPTAFPSADRTYLSYELYLTNFSPSPMTIGRVEILNSDGPGRQPIAAFEGKQLALLLQSEEASVSTPESKPQQLAAGATVIAFMWLPFDNKSTVPSSLRHRIFTASGAVEGAVIGTHRLKLKLLGPPLQGGDWLAADGPSNDQDNHHRRGVLVLEGHTTISRRDAIDWKRVENGASFSGDPGDRQSYYSYGSPVLAVADAKVVKAIDGLPENVPGHGDAFHPATPITMETIGGNTITLDLGDGQYAYYFHLQPRSLRVKVGERVRRGQLIAHVGCSGDAREPHLHFEVTTSPNILAGEGLPYVINRYRIRAANGEWQARIDELPLSNMVIDFGR